MGSAYNRREIMSGIGGLAGIMLLGVPSLAGAQTGSRTSPARLNKMTMYKSPTCGCCGKWAEAAKAAGFQVSIVPTNEMRAVKAKLEVPDELMSCHTTTIGGYVVEGHVPLDAVKRLLDLRPNIKGIAVPGMPLGSPGMETADGHKEDFKVMAFGGPGKIRVFS